MVAGFALRCDEMTHDLPPERAVRLAHALASIGSAANALAALIVIRVVASIGLAFFGTGQVFVGVLSVAAMAWLAVSLGRWAGELRDRPGVREVAIGAAAAVALALLLELWLAWKLHAHSGPAEDDDVNAVRRLALYGESLAFAGLVGFAVALVRLADALLVETVRRPAIVAGGYAAAYLGANAITVLSFPLDEGKFSLGGLVVGFATLFVGMFALLKLAAIARGLGAHLEMQLAARDNAAAARARSESGGGGALYQ